MSKWEKLIKRILHLSKDMRFEELKNVLESYGYEMRGPRGVYCIIKVPKVAELIPQSCMRNSPIIADDVWYFLKLI